jgi:phosphoribosylaminoimidazole-succinocarboxamide synthase
MTIFTPSTKAEEGHDLNVELSYVEQTVGKDIADRLVESSIALYEKAAGLARERGIIIADTKFEFGMHNGGMILIDEVLTPDSSRFWPLELYAPGKPQPSFDKQFVRDYLESLTWDKQPPAPALPGDIIDSTAKKYREAFRKITGSEYRG